MTTPHTTPELLACPFCGGKAAFVPRAVNIVLQKDPSDPKFGVSVICGQCSSECANMVDEAHAAAKWNSRAALVAVEPIPAGVLQAIKNAGLTLTKTQHGYELRKFGPAVAADAVPLAFISPLDVELLKDPRKHYCAVQNHASTGTTESDETVPLCIALPPGRGMVPMSEGEIVEFAKQIPWLGFRKDQDGEYTIPVIGPSEMKLIRMVEARALGIVAPGSGALGDGGSGTTPNTQGGTE